MRAADRSRVALLSTPCVPSYAPRQTVESFLARSPAGELRPIAFHHGPIEVPCEALTKMRRRTLQGRFGQACEPSEMAAVMRDRLIRRRGHVEQQLAQVRASLD